MNQFNKLLCLSVLTSSLLTACGGGGGGSGGGDPQPSSQAPASFSGGNTSAASIDTSNEDDLARAAVEGFSHAAAIASYEDLIRSIAQNLTAALPFTTGDQVEHITTNDGGLRQVNQSTSKIAANINNICSSGTASYDPATILSGTIPVQFDECVVSGFEANGKVIIEITDAGLLAVDAGFENFNITAAGETYNLDGVSISCESLRNAYSCRIIKSDFYGVNGKVYRVTNLSYVAGDVDVSTGGAPQIVNIYLGSIEGDLQSGFENTEAHAIRVFDYTHGYIDVYTEDVTNLDTSCYGLAISGSLNVGIKNGDVVAETGAVMVNNCEDYSFSPVSVP